MLWTTHTGLNMLSFSTYLNEACNCWKGYKRKPGTKPCAEGSCVKESITEQSDPVDRALENKRSADSAKSQGDMFAHHLHMADYHDNMAEYNSNKGRHNVSDMHARKSEEHHELAMQHKDKMTKEELELSEATYQGKRVPLNKPMAGDVKKSKVFVDPDGDGIAKKVNFGDKNMTIKKHIPARKKSFRARHNCDNPGPKDKARYWSCKAW